MMKKLLREEERLLVGKDKPKFLADGMLGSLARKLRIYGFDVKYDLSYTDRQLILISKVEDRILLTCDKELHFNALKKGVNSILVNGEDDEDRLVEIFTELKLKVEPEISRCPVCNGLLKRVSREEVKTKVYPTVLEKHEIFYLCKNCGKIYWMGSHWKRLNTLIDNIQKRLNDIS
jgi:hypothetical protein